jgi:hypothetical protein
MPRLLSKRSLQMMKAAAAANNRRQRRRKPHEDWKPTGRAPASCATALVAANDDDHHRCQRRKCSNALEGLLARRRLAQGLTTGRNWCSFLARKLSLPYASYRDRQQGDASNESKR